MKLTKGKIQKCLKMKNQTTKNKHLYIVSTFHIPTWNHTQKKKHYIFSKRTLRNFENR